jgi:hypothetical protein
MSLSLRQSIFTPLFLSSPSQEFSPFPEDDRAMSMQRINKEGEQCGDKHTPKGRPPIPAHFALMNHLPFLNPRKSDLRKPLKFYTSHQTSMGPLYVAIHQPI